MMEQKQEAVAWRFATLILLVSGALNYFVARQLSDGVALFIAGVLWGALLVSSIGGWALTKYYDIQKKLPYRWSCMKPGCYFTVSSNYSTEALLHVADDHERKHEMES